MQEAPPTCWSVHQPGAAINKRWDFSAGVVSGGRTPCLSPEHRSSRILIPSRLRCLRARSVTCTSRERPNAKQLCYCFPVQCCFLRKLIDLIEKAPKLRLAGDGGCHHGRNYRDGVSTVGVINGDLTLFVLASHRLPLPRVTEVVCLFVSFVAGTEMRLPSAEQQDQSVKTNHCLKKE